MFLVVILLLVSLFTVIVVEGVCNVDDHHPENGGYFIEGINGHDSDVDPMSTSNRRMHNSTWAKGISYADGSLVYCTDMFCSDTCRNEGCPTFVMGHTCSMIRFCYEEDSGSDVWLLPNEMALSTCNFTQAEPVCDTTQGSGETCCNYMVEEDADLKTYLFASKDGCEAGQRVAVQIDDYSSVGGACYGMGLTSSRIASCTCQYEDSVSTLSEPCHSQFVNGCLHHAPDNYQDLDCCENATCVGKHQNYSHPIGMALEDERKQLCRDDVPGRCLHTVDPESVDDCCTRTCSQCGTDVSPYLTWAACDTGNATSGLGECGYGGHGGRFSKYECNFTQCANDTAWHVSSDLYRDWIRTIDQAGYMKKLNLVEAAEELGLSTLVGALIKVGLDEALTLEGPYTLFAPNNDAFSGINATEASKLDLRNALLNHVVSGKAPPTLTLGTEYQTLGGKTLKLNRNGQTIRVNNAKLLTATGHTVSNGNLFVLEDIISTFPGDGGGDGGKPPKGGSACYDPQAEQCGCPADGCNQTKCEAKNHVWTDKCPNPCNAEACAAAQVDNSTDSVDVVETAACYDPDEHICSCMADNCNQTICEAKNHVWSDVCPQNCDQEQCANGVGMVVKDDDESEASQEENKTSQEESEASQEESKVSVDVETDEPKEDPPKQDKPKAQENQETSSVNKMLQSFYVALASVVVAYTLF